eukprot:jgi/Undpi1/4302/HiC_scaffold_17.g07668.m1
MIPPSPPTTKIKPSTIAHHLQTVTKCPRREFLAEAVLFFNPHDDGEGAVHEGDQKTVWHKEGYHVDYTKCLYLPDDQDDITEYVKAAEMLDTPQGQNVLGKFAMEIGTHILLFLWSDIQEYRPIPTKDYRYAKAFKIYGKYLRPGPIQLEFITEQLVQDMRACIEQALEDKSILGPDLFLELQKLCFRQIFEKTFMPLKTEHPERFNAYLAESAQRFNRINVNDFKYLDILGKGECGDIVHVVKESTGRHYAMKIQYKKELLRSFESDTSKVDNEKIIFEKCSHPFMLHMDYAFQTTQHAILVLNLVTSGSIQSNTLRPSSHPSRRERSFGWPTPRRNVVSRSPFCHLHGVTGGKGLRQLGKEYREPEGRGGRGESGAGGESGGGGRAGQAGKGEEGARGRGGEAGARGEGHRVVMDAIDASPDKRLDEERARFYAAEIALVLFHLHEMGLMYRDLKPQNVMVGTDGHIQLADMGGVADSTGHMYSRKIRRHGAPKPKPSIADFRRRSVLGTAGYMAPEMAELMNQDKNKCRGYNESVDWWSLGVTVYKMLTGITPPILPSYGEGANSVAAGGEGDKTQEEVEFPKSMSPSAVAFVSALLNRDGDKRLGTGPTGKEDIKSHPFMKGINWDLLESKHMEPPYKPPVKPLREEACFPSFEAMMLTLQEAEKRSGKKRGDLEMGPNDDQKCFESWRYVSPQTLRVEMGLAKAMDVMEANYKELQITGGSFSAPKPASPFHKAGKAVLNIGRVMSLRSPRSSGPGAPAAGSPRKPKTSGGSFVDSIAHPTPDEPPLLQPGA